MKPDPEKPTQLEFAEMREVTKATQDSNGTAFSDPAFAGNKLLPVHRWVPWVAGFSADFVKDALTLYVDGNSTVLDPFAGVGTTLVEAVLRNHNAVGFEINPYAALASRVKASAIQVSPTKLRAEISRFQEFFEAQIETNATPHSKPPAGFRTRAPFYSPKVLRKVLTLQDFIQTINAEPMRDLFRLAFASTMVSYSNYSYEPSLGRRASAGKADILDHPVDQTIVNKLDDMLHDIEWLQATTLSLATATVIQGSFLKQYDHLPADSADLIVTSPPYLNNYHYNRNTRPHLYWLGYVEQPSDLMPLEVNNFGKYWQTVRGGEAITLKFSLLGSDLEDRIEAIRQLNSEKGVYGGSGWANYAASYFNDCLDFAIGMKSVLRPGGTALIVIGSSILQGVFMPTDQYLAQIGELAGLELERIDILRSARVGNSIIQSEVRAAKAKSSHQLYEALVILRKP